MTFKTTITDEQVTVLGAVTNVPIRHRELMAIKRRGLVITYKDLVITIRGPEVSFKGDSLTTLNLLLKMGGELSEKKSMVFLHGSKYHRVKFIPEGGMVLGHETMYGPGIAHLVYKNKYDSEFESRHIHLYSNEDK